MTDLRQGKRVPRRRFRCPECFATLLGHEAPSCGHAIRDLRTGEVLDLRWVEMQPISRLQRPRRTA